jgi:hypothetical protein
MDETKTKRRRKVRLTAETMQSPLPQLPMVFSEVYAIPGAISEMPRAIAVCELFAVFATLATD